MDIFFLHHSQAPRWMISHLKYYFMRQLSNCWGHSGILWLKDVGHRPEEVGYSRQTKKNVAGAAERVILGCLTITEELLYMFWWSRADKMNGAFHYVLSVRTMTHCLLLRNCNKRYTESCQQWTPHHHRHTPQLKPNLMHSTFNLKAKDTKGQS